MISSKIIAGSVSEMGIKITTFELIYPRFIHAELMTHRVFSRNAASSRAIPTSKLVEIVRNNPVTPIFVGSNQPGMQAEKESEHKEIFLEKWVELARYVADYVDELNKLNIHKQTINRLLEPFLPIKTLVTATDWENWFLLRDSEYAQPEIRELARSMKEEMEKYEYKEVNAPNWHLPYITEEDKAYVKENYEDHYVEVLAFLSASRCARVSYSLIPVSKKSIEDEIQKGIMLYKNKHMSPFEHQATPWLNTYQLRKFYSENNMVDVVKWLTTPDSLAPRWLDTRNFKGWRQLRSFIEHGEIKVDF